MNQDVTARVRAAEKITRSVRLFELEPAIGQSFPAAEPGSHITVQTPAGATRSYSITEVTREGCYVICVARQPTGRGGSISMHDDVQIGDDLVISGPNNAFSLVEAESYIFIAGGIGITPIRAMHRHVRANARVRLLYLTRTPEETAFLDEYAGAHDAVIHHSTLAGRFDLWSLLGEPDDSTHVYCCASQPLMDQVRMLTMHWRPSQVHFEDFVGVAPPGSGRSFTAVWEPDGQAIEVKSDETLLGALRRQGIAVQSSCESGVCGTCVLQLLSGEAEHRDLVLSDYDHANRIIACVSRAAGKAITISPAT